MQPIRVLIVDDHAIVRQGIRLLVSTEPSIRIVGEANDGREAVCQAKRLLPDIILMDLVMPPEHGIKPIARIKQDHPQIKIIALTTFLDNLKISEALRAGAEGCLIKDGDDRPSFRLFKPFDGESRCFIPALLEDFPKLV